LGIILYEVVSGKVPFNGKTAVDVLVKHNSAPPVAPSQIRQDIPRRLERIILRALEKKREQRQESALQLAEELEVALFDFGVPPEQVRKRSPQSEAKTFLPESPQSSMNEESRTRAFDSGRNKKQVRADRFSSVDQTLPMSNRQDSSSPGEPFTQGISQEPQVDDASTSRDSAQAVSLSAPRGKNRVYLYVGLSIVAMIFIVFAIIKLKSRAAPSQTPIA
jgi:serine/threonine protein kinase